MKSLGLRGTTLVIILALLGVGTIYNVVRNQEAFNRLGAQSTAGAQAKIRQCKLFPISNKLITRAELAGWISAADLKTYIDTVPQDCGKVIK